MIFWNILKQFFGIYFETFLEKIWKFVWTFCFEILFLGIFPASRN
jgi:hypothetical protein